MKKPTLSIVVHTEEEFDWSAGFKADNNKVTHSRELYAMCKDMVDLGCCITFALDYAFVSSEEGKWFIEKVKLDFPKQIEFGAHLHPWVNPPFNGPKDEYLEEKDSYPGNLPKEAEFEKLRLLTEKIFDVTGIKPKVYLAGRYGVGPNTYEILSTLGYEVDVSITPFTDYRHQDGPDFRQFDNATVFNKEIKCIPHSTGYISRFDKLSDWLNKNVDNLDKYNHHLAGKALLRVAGVKKVRLSPEGFIYNDMVKLIASLQRIGIEHFIYSFHSSSAKQGCTPYSRTKSLNSQLLNTNQKTLSALKQQVKFGPVAF